MFKCLASVLLLVGFGLPGTLASAQEVTLSGTITTKQDGLSVPGATVSIEALGLTATTDAVGRYALTLPPEQAGRTVDVRVTAGGFQPRSAQVKLATGGVTLDFALGVGFSEELTVGSRAPGAESEKAVPVDILTSEQIQATGLSETSQVIQALAPSFNFPRPTVTDGTDTVRPATLRGLGPDQVLVLINGKRRHTSALVHLNGSIGRGSTGVDLNAIPVSAIERIEILRDGAAAQYGSDAIAGVLNIVLKSGAAPLTLSVKGGLAKGSFDANVCNPTGRTCQTESSSFSDGELLETGASYGWNAGHGSINVAAEYRDRNRTNRASADPRDQIRAGDAVKNAVEQPNHRWGDGDTNDFMTFVNAAFPVGKGETSFFYAFGGFSKRKGNSAGFYRRALDARNWPAIYPLGFLPQIEPDVQDFSGTVGVHGTRSRWYWDLSAQYGHNSFDFRITNSLNASLGPTLPPNQAEFDSGGLRFGQIVANLDLSRPVEVGLSGPLNVAFGAEFRNESYKIRAGEPASYSDGGVPNQLGGRAALGAQVFPGFRPSNEVDESRNSVAAYVDLEGDLASALRVGVAGRFEHYSDFGNTADGKLTVRLQPDKRFVVRGALSTGFRAPSLGQSFFSSTATNFLNVPGLGLQPFESLTLPVNTPQARVLGAQDLKPEDTVHASAGLVINPVPSFELTADYYHIAIDHRIVLSGNFTGTRIAALLAPFGANNARFFTNAIDTRTNGFDLTASKRFEIGAHDRLRLAASYNKTKTKIVGEIATPPQLVGFENVIFDQIERRRVTCGQPEDNVRLSGEWTKNGWSSTIRESRYGNFCSFTALPQDHQTHAAEWVTDLDVAYRRERFTIAVGIQNLFDTFPDGNLPAAPQGNFGIFTFPSHSPFGMNGRFAFAKLTYRF